MAKLQSLATRAEAASGMAEAEIALQALRAANGNNSPPSPEYGQGSQLLQLATAEFDQQNYAGALYLATEAKNAASAGQGRVASDDRGGGTVRKGESPFALPLRLQTTGRANVREGPGAGFKVLFTLETGVPVVAYSYVGQWGRVKDDSDRSGWIHQTLIGTRTAPSPWRATKCPSRLASRRVAGPRFCPSSPAGWPCSALSFFNKSPWAMTPEKWWRRGRERRPSFSSTSISRSRLNRPVSGSVAD